MDGFSRTAESEISTPSSADRSFWLLMAACAVIVLSFYASFMWMLDQWFLVEGHFPGPAIPILASIALWHALKKNRALPPIPRRAALLALSVTVVLAALVYVGRKHPHLLPAAKFLSSASYSILFAATTFVLLYSGALLQRAIPGRQGGQAVALGFALALLSLVVHFFALRGDLPRASVVAYVFLLFAATWYLRGWTVARILIFPLAMLFVMVPFQFVDETLGIPLRVMATRAAVFLMRSVGLNVVQVGNWFSIGSMEFAVGGPCSGLKSLVALAALGATFAYLTQHSTIKKLLLAAAAVPIAILTNIVRLACVGISSQLFGKNFAVTVFHDHAAVFLYILSIAILISLDKKVFQAEWFRIKNF
jgi:exosortase